MTGRETLPLAWDQRIKWIEEQIAQQMQQTVEAQVDYLRLLAFVKDGPPVFGTGLRIVVASPELLQMLASLIEAQAVARLIAEERPS